MTSPAPRRTGSRTGRSAGGAAALLRYSSSLQLSDTYIREFKYKKSALVVIKEDELIAFSLSLWKFYTAKKQYRKFETNIPRKGIARPQSNFHIRVCVFERLICMYPRPICIFFCRKICGPILGIYIEFTHSHNT